MQNFRDLFYINMIKTVVSLKIIGASFWFFGIPIYVFTTQSYFEAKRNNGISWYR